MTQTTYKNEFVFDKRADYKSAFKRYVDELFARAKRGELADRAERMALIDELIESYIAATGQRPDSVQLDRLATLCLREELTDTNSHKVKHEDRPILSDYQFKLRRGRDYNIKLIENYGNDLRNYEPPKRRKRTNKEQEYVEKYAYSRDKKRRSEYRKFITPGEVIAWNINGNENKDMLS
jgi:hypothetical protein